MITSLPTEKLPPEIWTYIFSFACMDDGSTGRALSSVSRAINILSVPVKYQSLSIYRHKHLFKFLLTFRDLPPARRRVKYLCISLTDVLAYDSDEKGSDYCPSESVFSDDDNDEQGMYDLDLYAQHRSSEDDSESTDELTHELRSLSLQEIEEVNDDVAFFQTPEGHPGSGFPTSMWDDDDYPSAYEEIIDAEKLELSTVSELLGLCCASLVHLTMHFVIRIHGRPGMSLPYLFPHLRDLVTNVDIEFFTHSLENVHAHVQDPSQQPPTPLFPCLENLALRVGTLQDFQYQLLAYYPPQAPALSQLHLSFRDAPMACPSAVLELLPVNVRKCNLELNILSRESFSRRRKKDDDGDDTSRTGKEKDKVDGGADGTQRENENLEGGEGWEVEESPVIDGWNRLGKVRSDVATDWNNAEALMQMWIDWITGRHRPNGDIKKEIIPTHWDYRSFDISDDE